MDIYLFGIMLISNSFLNRYLICWGNFSIVRVIGYMEYEVLFLLNGFMLFVDDCKKIVFFLVLFSKAFYNRDC